MNPGWLETQLVPLLHRSLSLDEQVAIRAEFSRHRRDLWEELGQLLFVEILWKCKELQVAGDIRQAVWRVSKRLARENQKTHSLSTDIDLTQPDSKTNHTEARLQIEEFLSFLTDHERALVQVLLDGTPVDGAHAPEQRKRLQSSIQKIQEKYQKYFQDKDRPT